MRGRHQPGAWPPGRLAQIVGDLLADDTLVFHCHETAHHPKLGGQWDDEGEYVVSNKESFCVGAMVLLEKAGRPSVAQRVASVLGLYERDVLMATNAHLVIEPSGVR